MVNSDKRLTRTGLTDKLLKEIVEAIRVEAKPERIILFGSCARGKWKDRSDIDIAVIPESGTKLYASLIEERIRTLLKIDILDFQKLNGEFQKEIMEDGIVLYEAA